MVSAAWATASGANYRSGAERLEPTPPRRDGQTELPDRRFDRDPRSCARRFSPRWRVAERRQCCATTCRSMVRPIIGDGGRARAPRVDEHETARGSSGSKCRRGVRGARSVQRDRRSRRPTPRPRCATNCRRFGGAGAGCKSGGTVPNARATATLADARSTLLTCCRASFDLPREIVVRCHDLHVSCGDQPGNATPERILLENRDVIFVRRCGHRYVGSPYRCIASACGGFGPK